MVIVVVVGEALGPTKLVNAGSSREWIDVNVVIMDLTVFPRYIVVIFPVTNTLLLPTAKR